MCFSDLLKKNNILLNAKSKNRWDLINEMVDLAVKNKELSDDDSDGIRNTLIEREKSMSTGIGNGVAIPHCSTGKVDNLIIIMAVLLESIDFDSIDNNPVNFVIMLIVPKAKLGQHIKTLANIAKLMINKEIRDKLIKLKTTSSILKLIKNFEKN